MTDIDIDRRMAYTKRWLKSTGLTSIWPAGEDMMVVEMERRIRSAWTFDAVLFDHEEAYDSKYGQVLLTSPYLRGEHLADPTGFVKAVEGAALEAGFLVSVGVPGTGLYARQADVAYKDGSRLSSRLTKSVPIAFGAPVGGCEKDMDHLLKKVVRDLTPLESEMRPDRDEIVGVRR